MLQFFAFSLLASLLPLSAPVESPVLSERISNRNIKSITEDSRGYIWIGTYRGLNRFNGREYRQYYFVDDDYGLPGNQAIDVFCDSRGRLWVVTTNGIAIYDAGLDDFRRVRLDDIYLTANMELSETFDGRILLNTRLSVFEYDEEGNEFKEVLAMLEKGWNHQINRLMVSPLDGSLYLVDPEYIRKIDAATFEIQDSVRQQGFPTIYYMSRTGEIWMGGSPGLHVYECSGDRFVPLPETFGERGGLTSSSVALIYGYGDRDLLFDTFDNGFYYYDRSAGELIHESEADFPFSPPDFYVNAIYADSRNNLWFGSIDQGCHVHYNYKERFNSDRYLASCLENVSVTALSSGRDDELWAVTLDGRLYVYDFADKRFSRVSLPAGLPRREWATVQGVLVDKGGHVWLTMNDGRTLDCTWDGRSLDLKCQYDTYWPLSITQDRDGTIWVGSQTSLLYTMTPGRSGFKTLDVSPGKYSFIPSVCALRNGDVMVMSFMNNIQIFDGRTHTCETLEVDEDDWLSCISRSRFTPTDAMEDGYGYIWIGTVANGLLRYDVAAKRLERIHGAPCSDICAIEEDVNGDIWVSTLDGLGKWERSSGRFWNFTTSDGIGGSQFYDRASCRLSDGTLVFGGTHGLTLFNPREQPREYEVPLVFEDLKVHNVPVRPEKDGCIDKAMPLKPDVRLRHGQNSFSISYAAIDYSEYARLRYWYKMEGYDSYWIDAGSNREALYANLPPGRYNFMVRATDKSGSLVHAENSLKIRVLPSIWASTGAILLYAVLFSGLLIFFIHLRRAADKEKQAKQRAEMETAEEKRVNDMNMKFFANMSHEFRTPLTMISGPVSQLTAKTPSASPDRKLLDMISRNVQRLQRLVNEILDFNKLENDTLKLDVRADDIVARLNELADNFEVMAGFKGIRFNRYGLEESFTMWFDADKLDTICYNLLSNAVKFTPSGGEIGLNLDIDGSRAVITVQDSGPGIPADQLEKIFERYYQVDSGKGQYNVGTGIGLYYARSLAVLHHGSLKAENLGDDCPGCRFVLSLPVSREAYSADELASEDSPRRKPAPAMPPAYVPGKSADDASDKPTVLIVDDELEVATYLNELLQPYYKTVCRFDADSAFKCLKDVAPDLIISDVVMPSRDGYELCRQIKDDKQYCHIPVILLTAKIAVENQVEGLNSGADAYVPKPFEPSYLLALVSSQLKNRERVKSMLGKSTSTESIDQDMLSPGDKAFMKELYDLMEKEMANSELDVTNMTKLMMMSRTKFYYKVKGLTGENPGAFFKRYKLNRAAQLLMEHKYTVSEIADMTGFSTLAHFSTSFKKQFGVSPSEYGR